MTYTQEEINFHTHSWYCGHGNGEISDYVREAEKSNKLKALGFSEHCPVPDDDIPDRMKYSQFDSYLNDVEQVSEHTNLTILKGVECDWSEKYLSYYEELGKTMDYMIGAVHHLQTENGLRYIGRITDFTPYIDEYVQKYTNILESGLFIYGCHPDLFLYSMKWNSKTEKASEKIIETAIKNNIPLEINGQGARKTVTDIEGTKRSPYPVDNFWLLAKKMGALICASSDAHSPEYVYEQKTFDFANRLGLKLIKWELKNGRPLWIK